jgi:hypothetical protein
MVAFPPQVKMPGPSMTTGMLEEVTVATTSLICRDNLRCSHMWTPRLNYTAGF